MLCFRVPMRCNILSCIQAWTLLQSKRIPNTSLLFFEARCRCILHVSLIDHEIPKAKCKSGTVRAFGGICALHLLPTLCYRMRAQALTERI